MENMWDSFVVGYSRKGGESALVVLRPVDAERSAEYNEVGSYTGDVADMIYELISGEKVD